MIMSTGGLVQLIGHANTFNVVYCYLFSRELNFAKMEQVHFEVLNLRDLAKNTFQTKKYNKKRYK